MNTTTKNASRDHAVEEQITRGRKAPLAVAAGLAVAAVSMSAVAVWQLTTGDPIDRPVERPAPAGVVDMVPDPAEEPAPAAVELGRRVADLDGDGLQDVVQFQAVSLSGVPDQITISWGTEGSEVHALTDGGEGELLPLRDLDGDGDGDLEVVVSAGGGEASWYDVFTFTGTDVVKVGTDGATGGGVPASRASRTRAGPPPTSRTASSSTASRTRGRCWLLRPSSCGTGCWTERR